MAVFSVRIESNAEWTTVEVRSSGAWARAPGRAISVRSFNGSAIETTLRIEDRVVRVRQSAKSTATLAVLLQLATNEERVSLHIETGGKGTVRLVSAVDSVTRDIADGRLSTEVVLYLGRDAARAAGARGGDPDLE